MHSPSHRLKRRDTSTEPPMQGPLAFLFKLRKIAPAEACMRNNLTMQAERAIAQLACELWGPHLVTRVHDDNFLDFPVSPTYGSFTKQGDPSINPEIL